MDNSLTFMGLWNAPSNPNFSAKKKGKWSVQGGTKKEQFNKPLILAIEL